MAAEDCSGPDERDPLVLEGKHENAVADEACEIKLEAHRT
jgi:hypothetical protein